MPKQLGTTNEVSRTSAPGSPVGGQTYHDSATGKTYVYDAVNSKWQQYGGNLSLAIQTAFVRITSDTTTTSTTFTDLTGVTLTLTTGACDLLIWFTFSASNSSANRAISFSVLFDGTSYMGAMVRPPGASIADSGAMVLRIPSVSAGSHTVKIQWKVSANTGQIRPVTGAPLEEHAALLVQEVTN